MSDVYTVQSTPDITAYQQYIATHPGGPDYRVPVAPASGPAAPDDWSDVSVPTQKAATPGAKAAPEDWSDVSTATPPPPQRQTGAGEAAIRGAIDTASFGLAPAIAGASQAGAATPEGQAATAAVAGVPQEAPGLENIGAGLANLFSSHPDPAVQDAYQRGRQSVAQDQQLAQEQHPLAFLGGRFLGALATPGFGIASGGTLATRALYGGIGGAVGGGLYGAGSGVSQGLSPQQIAQQAGESALVGAPTGALLNAALGPRIIGTAATPGQRAAQTAADLGAPLPRGVTSDRPFIQSTTAKLRSVPFAGEKIGERVAGTQEAAGQRVSDIADQMAAGATDRAAADTLVRPALQQVVDNNKQAIDAAYNGVRGMIDQDARFTMPRTDAALNAIMRERVAAGWQNPAQGLEQFRTVAGGATFNGAHRARVDARSAGDVLNPNPGYNAADFNRLTKAMTADLREMVRAAAQQKGSNPRQAVAAFDAAEKQFGELADQNKLLNRLANARGEGSIATLLGAAKEKGGDLKLLAQLRQKMPAQSFDLLGGTLLSELGRNASTGEFSLAQFVSNWNRVSDGAKRTLFSPEHLRNINDIVGMGEHIKGALRYSNTSHTASVLVLLDLAKDAALLGADIASGGLGLGSAVGAGTSVGLWGLTHWLASPAKTASMAAWMRSYRALALERTPARAAAFKIATRNMANTIGLDVGKTITAAERLIAGSPEQQNNQNQ